MISPSCLPIPPAFTSGRLHLNVPFGHSLPPHRFQRPQAHPGLAAALVEFQHFPEARTGRMITDVDLDRGIEILVEAFLEILSPEYLL